MTTAPIIARCRSPKVPGTSTGQRTAAAATTTTGDDRDRVFHAGDKEGEPIASSRLAAASSCHVKQISGGPVRKLSLISGQMIDGEGKRGGGGGGGDLEVNNLLS